MGNPGTFSKNFSLFPYFTHIHIYYRITNERFMSHPKLAGYAKKSLAYLEAMLENVFTGE